MMTLLRMTGFLVIILSFCIQLHAADEKEAALPRDTEGVVLNQDTRLDIPPDQKVVQVASNVVRAESTQEYVNKRMTAVDARLDELAAKIQELEKKIQAFEPQETKGAANDVSQSQNPDTASEINRTAG